MDYRPAGCSNPKWSHPEKRRMGPVCSGLVDYQWALYYQEKIRKEPVPRCKSLRYVLYIINFSLQLHSIPSPPFSDDLRQSCRTRLLGCLGDLNGQTTVVKSGDKSSKVSAVASDGEFWVSKVLSTIRNLEKDSKHLSLLSDADEDDIALRNKALEIAARLKSVSSVPSKIMPF